MARKDFDDYLTQVTNQYRSLQETLKEMSEEVENNMMSPEQLNQLKATIAPVKTSFDTLNYIRYLLDKPKRKAKESRYNKQNKRVLTASKGITKDEVIRKNDDILNSLKK